MKLKALLVMLSVAIAAVVWRIRQEVAIKRLGEIDRGERCISCNRKDVTVTNGKARCNLCGYVTNLESFANVQLTDEEIAKVTEPDRYRV